MMNLLMFKVIEVTVIEVSSSRGFQWWDVFVPIFASLTGAGAAYLFF